MASSSIPAISVPLDQLLEEARLKLAIVRERVEDLKTFGITAEWIDQFEADIATAVSFPSFEQQRNELKTLTAAKDAKLQECVQWGRKLRFRMSIVAQGKQAAGMQFPSKEWNQAEKNESRLITLFPTLLQLAKSQAADLVEAGQTEADITAGATLLEELVAANQVQEEYNLKRTGVTAERRTAYRKLYDTVNRINKSGQLIYGTDTPEGRLFRSAWTQATSDSEGEAELDGELDVVENESV